MNAKLIRAPAATNIAQMEPMLPQARELEKLLSLASGLRARAIKLTANPMPGLNKSLSIILRAMNSYYTNKIEGQHTMPAEIESALNNDYSNNKDIAQKQRIARAHLLTEAWGEAHIAGKNWREVFSANLITNLHYQLYSHMDKVDRVTDNNEPVNEGQFRTRNVTVGIHLPPDAHYLSNFIERWIQAYSGVPDGDMALIGLACAHHRLAWIHPFNDGNGRVTRLHSHLLLHAMGLTNGLWSPMRGLARSHQEYYDRLHNADNLKNGDYDGRGALTEQGLVEWIRYFLNVCIDQVTFMEGMLNLTDFKSRLETLLVVEENKGISGIKKAALNPLHYIAITGPMERGEFKKMTGMAERSADRLLKALLDYKLLLSDSARGDVYMGVPLHSMQFLFPRLWPEAEITN
ncbi:MAG: Fic family protein [Methylophilus sp.]